MRQSGLADLLPSLSAIYVGVSGGSLVMTPHIGEDVVLWKPLNGGDAALGVVDCAIFPHVDHEDMPDNSMAEAGKWAAGLTVPAYAIDDQTAIKVTDGAIDVVSDRHWKLFTPKAPRGSPDSLAISDLGSNQEQLNPLPNHGLRAWADSCSMDASPDEFDPSLPLRCLCCDLNARRSWALAPPCGR